MSRSNNCLYQWLEKKDLDPTNKLTDGEWAEFIKLHEDSFAEEGTKLGDETEPVKPEAPEPEPVMPEVIGSAGKLFLRRIEHGDDDDD